MGRIVVHTFATLDGVIDALPDEAFHPYMDDATMQESLDLVTASEAMLLGRETYQGLAKAWTPQTGPLADRLNTMPKYVLSRTLQAADDWDNTTVVSYDDVPGLRERLDLVSYGCGQLARDFLRDRLLDEFRLWLAPVVAGSGTLLFAKPDELLRLGLELAEARPFGGGAVRLTYRA
jgi:dihydrofolate reductase